jgi:hypothetical protein
VPSTLDLTENAAFLRVLLSDTLAWRQRLVEHFTFGSAEHVRVSSSYQCEFPPELLRPFFRRHETRRPVEAVRALVPITTRPKQAMLGFDCFAPDEQFAPVSRRGDAAALQAGYVRELIATSPAVDVLEGPLSEDLIEAIGAFTPGRYKRIWEEEKKDRRRSLDAYLKQGLKVQVCDASLRASLKECDSAAEVLAGVLDEEPEQMSSSECVLLALPNMRNPPTSDETIAALVRRYARAIRLAEAAGDIAVLQALADYGRRWELIVEVTVPVGRPWRVRVEEDRPLHWAKGKSRQVLALGDAQSVHFEVDVTDPNVSLKKDSYRLVDHLDEDVPRWLIEDVRDTKETLSLYTSERTREPYYATLEVAFTRPSYVHLTATLLAILLVVAAITALVVDDGVLVEKLAVLTVPTTFAAALLFLREQTPLGARLDAGRRRVLGLATIALWAVAIVRLFVEGLWIL